MTTYIQLIGVIGHIRAILDLFLIFVPICWFISKKHGEPSLGRSRYVDIEGVEFRDWLRRVGNLLQSSASHCDILNKMRSVFLDEGIPIIAVVWRIHSYLKGILKLEIFE